MIERLERLAREAGEIALGVLGQVLRPESSIYWVYLVSALAIACGVYVLKASGRRSLGGFLRYCFPRRVYANPSFRHDTAVFVINALLYSFVLLAPMAAASMLAATKTWALMDRYAPAAKGMVSDGAGPRIALTLAVLLAADLGFFLSHYAQHKVPVLWEFHKVHHSAPVLNPLTVFRRHPVDVVLERGLSGALVGGVLAVFAHLAGDQVEPLSVLGVNAVMFVFLVGGFNLQHSHVWLSFGPVLDRVLISPASHQIHHSTAPCHHDKNFGNVFAFWDSLVGTRYRPTRDESLSFGLGDASADYSSVWRLYWLPIQRSGLLLFSTVRRLLGKSR
jgi:sterol desaturase/sphingolipid hydroxylase (fatty acid hydroxylase superfamily)